MSTYIILISLPSRAHEPAMMDGMDKSIFEMLLQIRLAVTRLGLACFQYVIQLIENWKHRTIKSILYS